MSNFSYLTDNESLSLSVIKTRQQFEHQRSPLKYLNSLEFSIPNTEQMFRNIIEDIWEKYDTDNNGYIDKDEFYMFMQDTFGDDL